MPNRPDISLIRKYLNGELDDKAMYQLERQAQDDPALLDMIEGMEKGDPVRDDVALAEINDLIEDRVSKKGKKVTFIAWKSWSVAASLILIVGLGVLWLRRDATEPVNVVQQSKPAVVPETQSDPLVPEAEVKAKLTEHKEIVASVIHKRQNKVLGIKMRIDSPSNDNISSVAVQKQVTTAAAPVADVAKMSRIAQKSKKDSMMWSVATLNEVVVVGYTPQRKKDATASISSVRSDSTKIPTALAGRVSGLMVQSSAEPMTGWTAYRKYLERKAKKVNGVSGEVTLTFNLDQDGKPIDVVVLQGLIDMLNQKAINILNDGSKWKRGMGSGDRITLTIVFK